jgi:hypothetical protein
MARPLLHNSIHLIFLSRGQMLPDSTSLLGKSGKIRSRARFPGLEGDNVDPVLIYCPYDIPASIPLLITNSSLLLLLLRLLGLRILSVCVVEIPTIDLLFQRRPVKEHSCGTYHKRQAHTATRFFGSFPASFLDS